MGRDADMGSLRDEGDFVSIHAPAWGATKPQGKSGIPSVVSIHAPAWGATYYLMIQKIVPTLFQFTRPHGARLEQSVEPAGTYGVSIHAPAWGATRDRDVGIR